MERKPPGVWRTPKEKGKKGNGVVTLIRKDSSFGSLIFQRLDSTRTYLGHRSFVLRRLDHLERR